MMERKLGLFRTGLILLSAIFMIYGAYRGEMETVLTKAIHICLECIGIG